MRRLAIGLLAGAAILVAACTPSVTVENTGAEGTSASGIAVSGRGEVLGTPDTLQMSFGVSVLRPTVKQAVTDAATLADQLISTLGSSGVAGDDIQTANYSIHPEYDYSQEQRKLVGYRVGNTVTAKIRDIDAAGSVIDAAVSGVGDEIQVSGVSFSIEDDEELLSAARDTAWEDARSKAQQLADLAGLTLGKAVMISESVTGTPPQPLYRAAFDEAAVGSVETPIEAGQQQVAVTLQVRFDTN
ncbi:MAG: SIMPL domain-containing protein [Actinomycetota bacterium]|nr:SIMPL domain-containing protein [Actinomycetota bacterium]